MRGTHGTRWAIVRDAGCSVMDEIEQALTALRSFLQSVRMRSYFDLIDEALRLYSAGEQDQFREVILSNSVWGGAGSLCDINFLGQQPIQGRDARKDQKSLDLLLVQLAAALERQGLADDRIREIAAIFQRWLDDGVYDDVPPKRA